MIKIEQSKNKALACGIFFFIFSPHVIIFSLTIKILYFSIFLPSIFGFYYYIKFGKRTAILSVTILTLFMSLLYFSVLSLLHGAVDFQIPNELIIGLIIFFASFFYVYKYYLNYREIFFEKLIMDLHLAGFIQALIVVATFLSSDFRDFLYSFIGITETANRYLFMDVEVRRFQGIVPSGFSYLSTTHALLMVCGFWEFSFRKNHTNTYLLKFAIFQLAILFSIMLIGRTGLIVILIYTLGVIFVFIANRKNKIGDIFFVNYKELLFILIGFLFLVILTLGRIDLEKYTDNIEFAFELVIKLYNDGQLDRTTAGVLEDHYFLPRDFLEFVLGNGNFGRNGILDYIESDVGYILFIHGAGVVGLIIGYSFLFVGMFYAIKELKSNPRASIYLLILIIVLLVVNSKDYYFVSHVGYSQIYFLMLCAISFSVLIRRHLKVDAHE